MWHSCRSGLTRGALIVSGATTDRRYRIALAWVGRSPRGIHVCDTSGVREARGGCMAWGGPVAAVDRCDGGRLTRLEMGRRSGGDERPLQLWRRQLPERGGDSQALRAAECQRWRNSRSSMTTRCGHRDRQGRWHLWLHRRCPRLHVRPGQGARGPSDLDRNHDRGQQDVACAVPEAVPTIASPTFT